MAVQKLFPKAQVTIGPWIENGFYYDFDCPEPFTDADLKSIKKEMQKIIRRNLPITREEVTREEARARIEKIGEKYKLEILEGIKGDDITIYHVGTEWWDLCAGPHVESTGKIPDKAVDLEAVAGAYWRGDEKNAMLQRIYGTAWETPEQLKTYQKMREEAKKRDHRKLGQELGLFSIQQESAGGGLVFWHPNGSIMRHLIEAYWKQVHLDSGYELLYTPHMANVNLWKISGHLDFYRENMFNTMDIDEQRYQIKPMNCPCHCLIFKDTLHSYRELPKRWAELGTVYRYERSGVLHGLFRVRGFTQDDAHIFCLPDQIAPEIKGVLDLTERILREFGFTKFEVNLSTRPEKSVGSDDIWERATAALKEALAAKGWDYIEDIGGGAFYGPKIDIKIEDAIGRKWQCSTIQCDFNLPERFDLEYIASDGSRQRPIMLHRAIFGSLERFFGILVENYAGDFPLWLAPVQARILPVSEVQYEYADRAAEQLRAAGLRVEVDKSNERLGKMVRNSEKLKIPIMIIVGKSETETDTVNVRIRIKREEGEADDKEGDLGCMPVGDLVTFAQAAVASRLPVAEYFRQSKQI
eukprot:CAMPEP_0184664578 /NCGR_PEP_ID=MMETSP0308-20130426/53512_1 /TAXON_ID=38269 /ORGANISM="Gloeochaete witrockiana, Strain SAG 46.84" /LENGTH=582 /DNA_ID=CAMNT_0027108075 /DNA_START=421 /DNA_END=2169 /DNA_ORIENTATION=+